jgi:hypothetical protein
MPKFPDKIGQWAAILGVSLLLHACAGDAPVPPKSAPKPSRKPVSPLLRPVAPLPAPRIQPSPGLEGVIGANAVEMLAKAMPANCNLPASPVCWIFIFTHPSPENRH